MLKMRTVILILCIVLVTGFQAKGQDVPPGKWWKDPQVVKALDLTKDQTSQLEKAYADSRRELIKQKSRVEKEQFELQNLFDQKNVDEKEVKNQYRNVENARKELSDEQFQYIMEVRRIIGYDKYNQLTHGHLRGKGK